MIKTKTQQLKSSKNIVNEARMSYKGNRFLLFSGVLLAVALLAFVSALIADYNFNFVAPFPGGLTVGNSPFNVVLTNATDLREFKPSGNPNYDRKAFAKLLENLQNKIAARPYYSQTNAAKLHETIRELKA